MIYTPPQNIAKRDRSRKYAFIGGSIDNGVAIDWQKDMCDFFLEHGWGSFNPRRPDWNTKLELTFENPEFSQQVNWELNALNNCDLILLNFLPNTISPISLYELGRYSTSGKVCVVCPEGYWRAGNIEVGCNRDNIPLFETLDEFKQHFLGNPKRSNDKGSCICGNILTEKEYFYDTCLMCGKEIPES